MRAGRLLYLFMVACAQGRIETFEDPDTGAAPPTKDAGMNRDATVLDVVPPPDVMDASIDTFDAGCSTWDAGLGGIGIPQGTTATASSSYSTSTPDKSIDGDLGTGWNAGGFSGSLTITFPAPVNMNGIRFAASASPTSSETYTVYGYKNSAPMMIGQAVLTVQQGTFIQSPINVAPDNYEAIRIDVSAQSSWVSIVELSVLTQLCP